MTPAQRQALKADVLAKAGASFNVLDHGAVAAYYNASAAVGYYWRPSIGVAELNTAIVWSEFVALPVATQNAYLALTQGGTVDATNANVRSGFASIFAATVSLTNLVAISKARPTNLQSLFTAANICALPGAALAAGDVALVLAS